MDLQLAIDRQSGERGRLRECHASPASSASSSSSLDRRPCPTPRAATARPAALPARPSARTWTRGRRPRRTRPTRSRSRLSGGVRAVSRGVGSRRRGGSGARRHAPVSACRPARKPTSSLVRSCSGCWCLSEPTRICLAPRWSTCAFACASRMPMLAWSGRASARRPPSSSPLFQMSPESFHDASSSRIPSSRAESSSPGEVGKGRGAVSERPLTTAVKDGTNSRR